MKEIHHYVIPLIYNLTSVNLYLCTLPSHDSLPDIVYCQNYQFFCVVLIFPCLTLRLPFYYIPPHCSVNGQPIAALHEAYLPGQ